MAIKYISLLPSISFCIYLVQLVPFVICQALVTETGGFTSTTEYCSFFNNRAPQAQPGLQNCTWFKHNSCCQQQEIEATFGVVKPLKGASVRCQKFINYLMCYICAPNQNIFYQKKRLTVCRSFCDSFHEACLEAFLKGNRIGELYQNGREFCVSRRFIVGETDCFSFDVAMDTKTSSGHMIKELTFVFALPSVLVLYYILTAFSKFTFFDSLHECFKAGGMNTKCQISCMPCGTSRSRQVDKWTLLLVTILLGTASGNASGTESFIEVVNGDDVRLWASRLSNNLMALAEGCLTVEDMQKQFHEIPYTKAKVDPASQLNYLRESLEKLFDERKQLADETAAQIAMLYDDHLLEGGSEWSTGANSKYNSVDDLPSSLYLDANHLYRYQLNQSSTYSSLLQQKVFWDQSVVKLPESVKRERKDVIATIEWTSELDKIFKENKMNFPELRWQYFGSNTGMFRLYPGVDWKRDLVGYPEDFEPRMQPWYVDLKSGARNIVIILDTSASMKKYGLERAKTIASLLIGSLNHYHSVAVLESSSNAWDTEGMNMSGTVNVLGCHSGLFPATQQHKQELINAVQQLTPKGGSDHLPAFRKAFELLRRRQLQDEDGKDCGSLLIFITDGKLDEEDLRCTPGYHKYAEDNRKSFHPGDLCKYDIDMLLSIVSLLQYSLSGSKANIFTFLTSLDKMADLQLPGLLACQNNGVLSRILKDDTSYFDQMESYFHFIEATKVLPDPLLTGVYVSPIDNTAVLTVSSAVVSNITKKRIGVVGIDVALSDIEDLIRSSGLDGDVFMMNLIDGTAVIHPLAKRSYEIKDFLPHVFVSELESENGVPEEFSVVINRMMLRITGDYKVTKNATYTFLHKENVIRDSVKSVHYYFTQISGTNYGISLKLYSGDEASQKTENFGDQNMGTSYYHTVISSVSDELKQERLQLQFSHSNSKYYKGMNISLRHSVVAFGPEAFCNLSAYHEQFGSGISLIQKALNEKDQSRDKPCILTHFAREGVAATFAQESRWLRCNMSSVADIASVYVVTPHQVMRIYPGVVVPSPELLALTKEQWYSQAIVNQGTLTISPPRRGRHVPDVIVTLSQAVYDSSDCESAIASCGHQNVLAVAGLDVGIEEFQNTVLSSLTDSEHLRKSCGTNSQHYPCFSDPSRMCQTVCHLINHVGEVVYGRPWRQHASVSDFHKYAFKVLRDKRIFVAQRGTGYQATCLDTGEVVELQESGSSDLKNLFEMRHSCVEETLYYKANISRLAVDFNSVFVHDLDDDPCHSGIFFLTPVNNTDLMLLVFDDFQDFSGNTSNKACTKFKKESLPMNKRIERRPCSENITYVTTNFSEPCSRAHSVVLPCSYSAAALAAFHSFVFLFVCSLLMLVFLI